MLRINNVIMIVNCIIKHVKEEWSMRPQCTVQNNKTNTDLSVNVQSTKMMTKPADGMGHPYKCGRIRFS